MRIKRYAWKMCFDRDQKWQPVNDWVEIEKAFETLDKNLYLNLASRDEKLFMQIYSGDEERMLVAFTRLTVPALKSVLYDRSQTRAVPIYSLIHDEVWEYLPPEVCVSRELAKEALKYFYKTDQQLRESDAGWGEWPELWKLQVGSYQIDPVGEWSQIEAAIDAMNNTTHSEVTLSSNKSDDWVRVEGGNQGRVEVIWTDGYDSLFILMDQTQKTPIALRIYNKIKTDLDPRFCVDKSLAKRALKYFFETKKRDDTLHWADWSWYM